MSKDQEELDEFYKLAQAAKKMLADHEIETMTDTLAGHMGVWAQKHGQATRREGYDLAINLLIEWSEQWAKTHDEPFNYLGAAKALLVAKDMQLPLNVLEPKL